MAKTKKTPGARYAIKLQFSYHTGRRNAATTCTEMRILHFPKGTRKNAIAQATQRGQDSEHTFENDLKQQVHYRFDGIKDVLELGVEADPDEVWYEVIDIKPKKRKPAAGSKTVKKQS